jgi:hypothetical protein
MDFYWVIPVVAIAGGITFVTLNSYWKSKRAFAPTDSGLKAALEANTAASTAILARLDSIEARLGAVEKTLTDIP